MPHNHRIHKYLIFDSNSFHYQIRAQISILNNNLLWPIPNYHRHSLIQFFLLKIIFQWFTQFVGGSIVSLVWLAMIQLILLLFTCILSTTIFNSDTFFFVPRRNEMCTFWLPTNRHLKRIFLIFSFHRNTGTDLDYFLLENSYFEFKSNFNWIINLWFTFWSCFLFRF